MRMCCVDAGCRGTTSISRYGVHRYKVQPLPRVRGVMSAGRGRIHALPNKKQAEKQSDIPARPTTVPSGVPSLSLLPSEGLLLHSFHSYIFLPSRSSAPSAVRFSKPAPPSQADAGRSSRGALPTTRLIEARNPIRRLTSRRRSLEPYEVPTYLSLFSPPSPRRSFVPRVPKRWASTS